MIDERNLRALTRLAQQAGEKQAEETAMRMINARDRARLQALVDELEQTQEILP